MEYKKPPLSFEQQAEQLIQRGLIADKNLLIYRLQNVNYYRLSGYCFPYRQSDDSFKTGTTFDSIWQHYAFDRRLRLIVMDAIERVEISVRTQLIYTMSHSTGAFGYASRESLPNLSQDEYNRWLENVKSETEHSREKFVDHFKDKYGDFHKFLPLWMAGEIVSFGCTFTMFRGVSDNIKREVAKYYSIDREVLESWLKTINVIRNICAHHGRLWNRELGVKPYIPRKNKYPQWHEPIAIPQHRIFGILTILRYLLKIIAPQSKWDKRLFDLLNDYPTISRWSMGMPDNWRDSLLWK